LGDAWGTKNPTGLSEADNLQAVESWEVRPRILLHVLVIRGKDLAEQHRLALRERFDDKPAGE